MPSYKGLLVFHGVGVGKTCTAVTISNSFIELYKKDHKNNMFGFKKHSTQLDEYNL